LALLEEVGFEKIRITLSNVKNEGVDRLLNMDLNKHPKVYSVRFWDEPPYRELGVLKKLYERCEKEYPNIIWTTNLLPDYIHFQDLGSPYRKETIMKIFWEQNEWTEEKQAIIDKFFEEFNMVEDVPDTCVYF
jgi:hypothetical protein